MPYIQRSYILIGVGFFVFWIYAIPGHSALPNSSPPECPVKLTVVEVSEGPVIKKGDPGTEDNKYGLETGCVFKQGKLYHLFTAEMIDDPLWVKMRFGHWTSPDRVNWTRINTLAKSSGDQTGIDLKAAIWSPMPFYDEKSERWHMYYVGYRSNPDDGSGWCVLYDSRIIHAVSQTPGLEGLDGPWKDIGIALKPDWEPWKENGSQPWEGLQGVDSMSPPYKVGNKWLAFYGSAQMQVEHKRNKDYPQWGVGLAEAPTLTGPWKRCAEGNPMPFGNFAENPIVTPLPDGAYMLVCDAASLGIGYAWSPDGLRWSHMETIEIPNDKAWWGNRVTRTPLGLVPESDGSYTVFFMIRNKIDEWGWWQELAFIRVKKDEK